MTEFEKAILYAKCLEIAQGTHKPFLLLDKNPICLTDLAIEIADALYYMCLEKAEPISLSEESR